MKTIIADLADDVRYLVADAIAAEDLHELAAVAADDRLVAGAAGFASAIADLRADSVGWTPGAIADDPASGRPRVVLSGSCSRRTLDQLAALEEAGRPMHRLDALGHPEPEELAQRALDWWDTVAEGPAAVIYSSLPPTQLAEVQAAHGVARSAEILEQAMGLIARGLRDRGVRGIIAAGGETSGAVVSALEIDVVTLGPEAARGVPWIYSNGTHPMALLLKSGNFGDADLLVAASAGTQEGSR